MGVPLLLILQLSQPSQPPASAASVAVSACTLAREQSLSGRVADVCDAEEEQRLGLAAPPGSSERTAHLEAAARRYSRAATGLVDMRLKKQVLTQLSRLYEKNALAQADQLELVLRQLIAVDPADLSPVFRLARLEEEQGQIDVAEMTLVDARRSNPQAIEPVKELAQFYVRRVTALQPPRQTPPDTGGAAALERDDNGVYTAGKGLEAPKRIGTPRYPPSAQAAGVQGVVGVEIVIGVDGTVSEARVTRSIPLLDDAALAAVKTWKFEPTLLNGRPVPVKSTVSVNFTTSR